MDSINKNQAEQNHKDLAGKEAVDKLKELVKQAETCFFCTSDTASPTGGSRPMSPPSARTWPGRTTSKASMTARSPSTRNSFAFIPTGTTGTMLWLARI